MSTTYEAVGRIIALTPTQRINDKMEKRTLVIETPEQYPQQIPFEAINAACSKLDNLRIGQEVAVHFNLQGRSWNGKYCSSNRLWKVESTEQTPGKVTENPKQEQREMLQFSTANERLERAKNERLEQPAANDEDLPF